MVSYKKRISDKHENDSATILYSLVEPSSTVLDVGCACGDLAYKLHSEKSCIVYGWEYNSESVEKCKSLNIFKEINQIDLNLLQLDDWKNYYKHFDYIIFGDVLEHTYIPEEILKISKNFLKEDGKILISLPNIAHASIKANLLLNDFTYTEIGILDKTHIKFFTYKSIAKMLAECQLSVEEVACTVLPQDGYQPHKFNEIDETVQKLILSDKHSLVFQYIIQCSVSKMSETLLAKKNSESLNNLEMKNKTVKAGITFKIKRLIISKFSKLIKYIEKFR